MSFTKLEEFIFTKMSETKLPGLSAAIVKGDEVIWAKAFGFRDLEHGLAATPHTLYGIGSVTKSFTALSIMQLADAFFGANRPASRSKSATLTEQTGHLNGANRPPRISLDGRSGDCRGGSAGQPKAIKSL
ncbi:beta-lactamase family protein [Dehalococcoidia bacterium]|nr:beta-lactamase family protein [Dehalococcoidia bacterium]